MANFIEIVRELHDQNIRQVYSTVGHENVCIIEYKKDGWISFNVEYTNRDKIRSSHYTDGINALFDYNSPKYNYSLAIYKKVKALDKRLIDDGTMALGDYDYGNAVIRWLGKPFHGLNHTRNKADHHMARDYGIIKLVG